ncbi:MAG: hypothetical protein MZW92_73680 [Comamonadaceae bacterium]|nr:hypothetical protein [Comamonadaceae bacterium]
MAAECQRRRAPHRRLPASRRVTASARRHRGVPRPPGGRPAPCPPPRRCRGSSLTCAGRPPDVRGATEGGVPAGGAPSTVPEPVDGACPGAKSRRRRGRRPAPGDMSARARPGGRLSRGRPHAPTRAGRDVIDTRPRHAGRTSPPLCYPRGFRPTRHDAGAACGARRGHPLT